MYLQGSARVVQRLHEGWQVRWAGAEGAIAARVPGYVQHDLLEAGRLPDPFFRDNERVWQEWCDRDYTYACSFDASKELQACEHVELVCDGIDTVGEVWLNGTKLGDVDNMFRTWRFGVREILRERGNELRVELKSPVRVCAEREARYKGSSAVLREDLDQRRHVRKMACSFGWDWGIVLPLSGIWKEVRLEGWSRARLAEVWHRTVEARAAGARVEGGVRILRGSAETCDVVVRLIGPAGDAQEQVVRLEKGMDTGFFAFEVREPALWWPNGMGGQPLYRLEAELVHEGTVLSRWAQKIGLRTIELVQEPDKFGQSFYVRVNGLAMFAKGVNWIPVDAIISRITVRDYRRLLEAARDAHMNMVRVWGGGMYEPDEFYEICDELGLLVWQDLMAACTLPPTYREFLASFGDEARDAVVRLRHHASVALWCGNNECEEVLVWRRLGEEHRREYEFLFDEYLRGVVTRYDASRTYWPSSPHTPGSVEPQRQDSGDSHYWSIWAGVEPFEAFFKRRDRFMSEFGYQSFPDLHTVKRFSVEEDWDFESTVMKFHQRGGEEKNAQIRREMEQRYGVPERFEDQLVVSQLVQADMVRLGVEHLRRLRHEEQCMGALYWQLHDNWPVTSWSSIDYFGRWKALYYAAREFFAPLLVSVYTEEGFVRVVLVNDGAGRRRGRLVWAVRTYGGKVVRKGSERGEVGGGAVAKVWEGRVEDMLGGEAAERCYFVCEWREKGERVRRVLALSGWRESELRAPGLEVVRTGRQVRVKARRFAARVYLWCSDERLQFSENFFDLLPREERVVELVPVREPVEDNVYETVDVSARSLYEMCGSRKERRRKQQ